MYSAKQYICNNVADVEALRNAYIAVGAELSERDLMRSPITGGSIQIHLKRNWL